ncbi:hypothetical protein MTO96_007583 [Rhipicephalus appendiculatus]
MDMHRGELSRPARLQVDGFFNLLLDTIYDERHAACKRSRTARSARKKMLVETRRDTHTLAEIVTSSLRRDESWREKEGPETETCFSGEPGTSDVHPSGGLRARLSPPPPPRVARARAPFRKKFRACERL